MDAVPRVEPVGDARRAARSAPPRRTTPSTKRGAAAAARIGASASRRPRRRARTHTRTPSSCVGNGFHGRAPPRPGRARATGRRAVPSRTRPPRSEAPMCGQASGADQDLAVRRATRRGLAPRCGDGAGVAPMRAAASTTYQPPAAAPAPAAGRARSSAGCGLLPVRGGADAPPRLGRAAARGRISRSRLTHSTRSPLDPARAPQDRRAAGHEQIGSARDAVGREQGGWRPGSPTPPRAPSARSAAAAERSRRPGRRRRAASRRRAGRRRTRARTPGSRAGRRKRSSRTRAPAYSG